MAEILTLNGSILTNNGNALTIDAPSPGPVSSVAKQVNFIDYDGTILYSYTRAEFNDLSELPANPSHEGLTSQGWNWTMAQITAQLTAVPGGDIWVGQMYITESGDTEIDVTFDDPNYLSPYLCITINGTVTIDWGDESTLDTMTGTSLTTKEYKQHVYASIGNYTIKISVSSGQFAFYNNSNSYPSVLSASSNAYRQYNRTYAQCIRAVRIGENAQIGVYAFNKLSQCKYLTIPSEVTSIGSYTFNECYSLTSLTIPSEVTSIGSYAFTQCYSLTLLAISSRITSIASGAFNQCYSLISLTITNGITSIESYVFSTCQSLTSLVIPSTVTSIGGYAFQNCYSLTSLTIPSSVTSIGSYAFSACYSLTSLTISGNITIIDTYTFTNCRSLISITIPNGITSIGNNAFNNCYSLTSLTIPSNLTSIGNNGFSNCQSLSSLTIPSSVTSIGNNAFRSNASIEEYHFKATTPPTLGGTAFSGIVSDTIIYVPAESLEAYQTAENWSTYASYMVGE